MKGLIFILLLSTGFYIIYLSSIKKDKPQKVNPVLNTEKMNQKEKEPEVLAPAKKQNLQEDIWDEMNREKQRKYTIELNKELKARQIIEHHKRQGYEVELSEDLDVLSRRPIRKQKKRFQFKHLNK